MMIFHTICFHTEMLHDDKTWKCLQIVLRELDQKKVKATFLVYPFRSLVARKDIADRVKELAERGHEIGQHTHFYAGMKTDRPDKRNDLSDANVRACITRDYQWLKTCGIEPEGFCAGAWLMTETVLETLAELGFIYDCSVRLPHFRKNFEMPHLWSEGAQIRDFNGYPLVLLPTTNVMTIFEYLHPKRRRQRALTVNSIGYHLIYNHDYDLLQWKVRMGLSIWTGMVQNIETVQQLAKSYLKA